MEWIIVSSQTGARVFKPRKSTKTLSLVKEFKNVQGKLRNRDLARDRAGMSMRTNPAGRAVRGTTSTSITPHEEIAVRFSKTIASFLESARKAQEFDSLILVSEPRFLGKIRSQLSELTKKKVNQWVPKDLQNLTRFELEDIFLHQN